jgi:hypothetical protein
VLAFVEMKITSQSAEELVLTEGSASGIVVGAVLVIGGPVVWYFLHRSNPVVMWIALGMVVVGAIVILMSSSITVVANKTSGKLSRRSG